MVDWLSCCRPSFVVRHLSSSVSCYINCFFSVRLNPILIKLDMSALGYEVAEWILNICISNASIIMLIKLRDPQNIVELFQLRGCSIQDCYICSVKSAYYGTSASYFIKSCYCR